jgi:hypothetical protein
MALKTPSRLSDGIPMDFVTDLTESTESRHSRILVIVDQPTKMAIYLPWREDIDSRELAWLFFENVICKQRVPDIIVTARGTQFTSRF